MSVSEAADTLQLGARQVFLTFTSVSELSSTSYYMHMGLLLKAPMLLGHMTNGNAVMKCIYSVFVAKNAK